ncbi:MAG: hypothetical protein AAFN74_14155, partial [Myxococcota bacterium]
IDPADGRVRWIAGSRQGCFIGEACGDGGPAEQASLSFPISVDFGPDGSMYILSTNRLRRVRPDGIIETVAGNGENGHTGNGGLAVNARFEVGRDLAVAADGSIYIASRDRIRRIDPNGIIRRFAGTGSAFGLDPNGPVAEVRMDPLGLALDREGRLLVGTHRHLLRVDPDGVVRRIAGGVPGCNTGATCGDGGPAVDAIGGAGQGVAVGADGSIYFADNFRVRQVRGDGTIYTVVGGNNRATCQSHPPDGAQTANVPLCMLGGAGGNEIAISPDGTLWISSQVGADRRILRVDAPLPGFTDDDIVVAAPGGGEVFVFDSEGRHQRTYDAQTGAVRDRFAYDPEGRLSAVTDVDGRTTTIERNPDGSPAAIVGPYGQRTELGVDANGYLAEVRTPGLAPLGFAYDDQGLLTRMIHRDGSASTFAYDQWGRLTRDDDPAGGFQVLDNPAPVAWPATSVTVETALGRAFGYTEATISTTELGTTGALRSSAGARSPTARSCAG